jgi:hypothetical protein
MGLRRVQIIFLIVLIASVVQGQKSEAMHEQVEFSEESPIQNPVPLPPNVFKMLLQRNEVKQDLPFFIDSKPATPDQLFTATEIHLRSTSEVDLVVAGIPPMTGADNDWYWIIRSGHKNPKIILFMGCNGFKILKTMTNGYHDIRSFWGAGSGSVTRLYKFNGIRYKLRKEVWQEDYPCDWLKSQPKPCRTQR